MFFIDHVSENLQLAREASDDHHPPWRGVNIEDEVWTLNFEDEVWILRKATGFDTSKMTSHVPYHLRLLTVFYYSVLTCATRANLAQRRKKHNNMTCSCSWHDMFKDIWTEIGSPIIQCIKWLYPVNVFYATCPVLWRDRSYSQVLLGTLDVLWSGYFCVGGARAVGGMVWEAGIRSGVTVVTFGMCEIQDWNLKLWKLFYLKVVKLWIRNFFCTNWWKIGMASLDIRQAYQLE